MLHPAALVVLALVVSSSASGSRAHAQDVTQRASGVTRAALESEAAQLEAALRIGLSERDYQERSERLAALQDRLRTGDFSPGDRIVVRVTGHATMTDTFTVQSGTVLRLPEVPEIRLAGVLRSELAERVEAQVATVLRGPDVAVTPLVRIGILGEVVRPGYYTISPEAPLAEALMAAGGLSTAADMNRLSIARAESVLLKQQPLRHAMARGASLDEIGVRGGDELLVGERRRPNSQVYIGAATLILGVVTTVLSLR